MQLGIATTAVPRDRLLPEAQGYVRTLAASCSPTSLMLMKRQVYRHLMLSLGEAMDETQALMDESEHDVLAYMAFPAQHRTKLHSTNPLERLNKEVKRRADVVGIFPNEASITRLIGAVLFEQNDEWLLQHRYMQIEGMAELTPPLIDADPATLPPMAA